MIKIKSTLIPGLITGVGLLVVGFVLSWITGLIFPSVQTEYETSGLFRPWSDPIMQLYFAYPFILGIVLAFVWDKLKAQVKGKNIISRGLNFGLTYFLVATIPGMFITYSSFYVSTALVLSWTINGLLEGVIAGIILAKVNR